MCITFVPYRQPHRQLHGGGCNLDQSAQRQPVPALRLRTSCVPGCSHSCGSALLARACLVRSPAKSGLQTAPHAAGRSCWPGSIWASLRRPRYESEKLQKAPEQVAAGVLSCGTLRAQKLVSCWGTARNESAAILNPSQTWMIPHRFILLSTATLPRPSLTTSHHCRSTGKACLLTQGPGSGLRWIRVCWVS